MTTPIPPQQSQPTPHWRERALLRSEAISDAWEVTKAYAGRIAEWVLFGCMVANIIEILVTLPSAVSSTVLGIQVVMLDVGGFSLTSMGEQARERGDERAARRASVTGNFLIGITILTLLLVTLGLLWPAARVYTDMAEKGLILVRVIMTVIYGHVIHSLRRSVTSRHATPTQVEALLATFNQQVQQLATELARVQEGMQHQLASELTTMREGMQDHFLTELASVHERLQQCEAHHEAREAGTPRRSEAAKTPREASPSVSPRNHEARTKVLPLRRQNTLPTEKRAMVYALLDANSHLSSYEIAEQTGYPPSTIQRYMKDWKTRPTEATREATDTTR